MNVIPSQINPNGLERAVLALQELHVVAGRNQGQIKEGALKAIEEIRQGIYQTSKNSHLSLDKLGDRAECLINKYWREE